PTATPPLYEVTDARRTEGAAHRRRRGRSLPCTRQPKSPTRPIRGLSRRARWDLKGVGSFVRLTRTLPSRQDARSERGKESAPPSPPAASTPTLYATITLLTLRSFVVGVFGHS